MAIVCTAHVWVQASGQMVCRLCLTPKNQVKEVSKSDSGFGVDNIPQGIRVIQPPKAELRQPKMTPDPQNQTKTAGRKPGQPTRPADVVAIGNLQDGVSRLLWYLSENPASALGVLLARCAKGGVEKARAEKGLTMIEAAVASARTQMEAAYAAPKREEGVQAARPTVSL